MKGGVMKMYPFTKIASRCVLLLMAVFALSTVNVCAEGHQDQSQPEAADGDQEEMVSYTYQAQGRRDPFTPIIPKEAPIAEIQPQRRPEQLRGPLERFELRQLRLVAVMVVQGAPRAMVAAPDGKSYTVKIDDYLGLNGGRVKDIQTRRVDVDENGMRVETHPDRIIIEETGIESQSGRTVKEDRYIVL